MKKILLTFAILLWPTILSAGQLTAQVDKNPVPKGELLQLTIRYDGDDGNVIQPDLSVLQTDFTVYSTSTSIQSRYVNGVGSQSRSWNVRLLPNRDGKIVIPAISAGKYKTSPIEIDVGSVNATGQAENMDSANNSAANTADLPNFDIKFAVSPGKYYVQQQINAELIITENRGLQLTEMPRFADNDDWVIKMLAEPTLEEKDGVRKIKFYYALFPQKSGKLEIPSVRTDAFYISYESAPSARPVGGGFFGMFDFDMQGMMGVRQPVVLRSNPVDIEIMPADVSAKGEWWLPAKNLALSAHWMNDKPQFKVGETVAREIVMTAVGVAQNQLPELTFTDHPALKQYPEQPQYTSTVRGDDVISQAIIRVVYIPQQSGEITLPEISLNWFNVTTGKIEKAVIAAEKITVAAGTNMTKVNNAAIDTPKITQTTDNNENPAIQEDNKTKNSNSAMTGESAWYLIAAAFIAGLIVSFLLFSWLQKRQNRAADELDNIINQLKRNDYRALQTSLLRWGKQHCHGCKVNNLNELAQAINQPEFSQQIDIINRILYAGANEIPDEKMIINCLKKYTPAKKSKQNKTPLPHLYE